MMAQEIIIHLLVGIALFGAGLMGVSILIWALLGRR
jgi:hypothetical protein